MWLFKSRKIFKLAGYDVWADATWLIIPAILNWIWGAYYFPFRYPGLEAAAYNLMAIGAVIGFFISLIMHELGHALIASHYHINIVRIRLFLFGGVAEIHDDPATARQDFFVTAAGPVMSGLMAVLFWILARIYTYTSAAPAAAVVYTLDFLSYLNFLLVIVNLIPVFPLDGGHIVRALLWQVSGSLTKATRQICGVAKYFAYPLMGYAIYEIAWHDNPVYYSHITTGIWTLFISLFMVKASKHAVLQTENRVLLSRQSLESFLCNDRTPLAPDSTLEDAMKNRFQTERKTSFPVISEDRLVGILTLSDLALATKAQKPPQTPVARIMTGIDSKNTLDLGTRPDDVLKHLYRNRLREAYITSEDIFFQGIVEAKAMDDYLAVARAFDEIT